MNIGRCTYLVNEHMHVKISTSRSTRFSQYIIVQHTVPTAELTFRTKAKVKFKSGSRKLHATFYLLATAMFAQSVIACKILTVELYMTSTFSFRTGQGQM